MQRLGWIEARVGINTVRNVVLKRREDNKLIKRCNKSRQGGKYAVTTMERMIMQLGCGPALGLGLHCFTYRLLLVIRCRASTSSWTESRGRLAHKMRTFDEQPGRHARGYMGGDMRQDN